MTPPSSCAVACRRLYTLPWVPIYYTQHPWMSVQLQLGSAPLTSARRSCGDSAIGRFSLDGAVHLLDCPVQIWDRPDQLDVSFR